MSLGQSYNLIFLAVQLMRPELQLLDAPWDLQEKNWNEWNAAHRVGTPDTYMLQLRDEAQRWASQSGKRARMVAAQAGWQRT